MFSGTGSRLVTVLLAVMLVGGCAAGYRTVTTNGHEKTYRVDEDGNKVLAYEIDKDGALIVHDESDPRAQELLAAQEQEKKWQALEEQRIELIRAAPKRAANDPIRVVIHPIDMQDKLREAQHTEGAIEQQFRAEFDGDPVIRVMSPTVSKGKEITQMLALLSGKAAETAPSAGPAADVEVATRAYVEEKAGYNKTTKKLATYGALVYEAKITSNYLPAEYTVVEEGNVFRNAEVTKRFAAKVRAVITQQIGPTIPADRGL